MAFAHIPVRLDKTLLLYLKSFIWSVRMSHHVPRFWSAVGAQLEHQ
jgi:hypothetical protein